VARKRTIKDPPKRGNLTEHQVQRAVEKVVLGKHGGGTTSSTWQTHHMTAFKVGRDAKTGRFITCKEAERRKSTAVVETIKRSNKKK
jgi:hypothetical protein